MGIWTRPYARKLAFEALEPRRVLASFINSVTPTVGWPGVAGNPDSGTLVTITGIDIHADPSRNEVLFSDSSGQPSRTVKATIVATTPPGGRYTVDEVFGGPGTVFGKLQHPWDVAVSDATGDVYVVDVLGRKVVVFDETGIPKREVAQGFLDLPWSIALDRSRNVYVSESRTIGVNGIQVWSPQNTFLRTITGFKGSPRDLVVNDEGAIYVIDQIDGQSAELVKFDSQGRKLFGIRGPSDAPLDAPQGVALSPSQDVVYLTDRDTRSIYRFTQSGAFISRWRVTEDLGFPSFWDPGSIAVDWQGFLYVQLADVVVKLDDAGNSLGEVIPLSLQPLREFRTVDINKTIYGIDTISDVVRTFQADNRELVVRVPPGAQTGPIRVISDHVNGRTSADSRSTFRVLGEDPGRVSISRIEATQGVSTYPFIAGKETLVFAQLDGMFGHPTRDRAYIEVTRPNGSTIKRLAPPEEIGFGTNGDFAEFGFVSDSVIHFHLSSHEVNMPGEYKFEVHIERDGRLINSSLPWTTTIRFQETKPMSLAFVQTTNVPNNQWHTTDPFPWFDIAEFLRGIKTFERQMPLSSQAANYRFASGLYLDFLQDGLQEDEQSLVHGTVHRELRWLREVGFEPDRFVGLIDPTINMTSSSGFTFGTGVRTVSVVFRNRNWGSTLSHEVGHTFGLSLEGATNHVKDDGGNHSVNQTLENEDKTTQGLPIVAWNTATDRVLTGRDETGSIMSGDPLVREDDEKFFESMFRGEKVDYHFLCEQLAVSGSTGQLRPIPCQLPEAERGSQAFNNGQGTSNLALVGTVTKDGEVGIIESFLTEQGTATPDVVSGYSVAFVDTSGADLAEAGFDVAFRTSDATDGNIAFFDVTTPYPEGTAIVEIRHEGEVLHTLTVSANTPTVEEVHVQFSRDFPTISWTAQDVDGDTLVYHVLYSADGGESFRPIAVGLSSNQLVWYDDLSPGTAEGIIKVIASDGLNTGSAASNVFELPTKPPTPVILSPSEGQILPQGSRFLIEGSAFDPEDGVLSESQLRWTLDNVVDLGSDPGHVLLQEVRELPTGGVFVPLQIGTHTLTLRATDSDGQTATKTVAFRVVSDTDRDGFSDSEERNSGSDSTDPLQDPDPPVVAASIVQSGLSQRSYVDRFDILFSEEMNLSTLIADGTITDAVKMTRLEDDTAIDTRTNQFRYMFDSATGISQLNWSLDPEGATATLTDGRYEVIVDGAAVKNAFGAKLDGNFDGFPGGDYRFVFHRIEGDSTGDGRTDEADMELVNAALGRREGNDQWNPNADLDHDGRVSVRDRLVVFRNLGKTISDASGENVLAAVYATDQRSSALGGVIDTTFPAAVRTVRPQSASSLTQERIPQTQPTVDEVSQHKRHPPVTLRLREKPLPLAVNKAFINRFRYAPLFGSEEDQTDAWVRDLAFEEYSDNFSNVLLYSHVPI